MLQFADEGPCPARAFTRTQAIHFTVEGKYKDFYKVYLSFVVEGGKTGRLSNQEIHIVKNRARSEDKKFLPQIKVLTSGTDWSSHLHIWQRQDKIRSHTKHHIHSTVLNNPHNKVRKMITYIIICE